MKKPMRILSLIAVMAIISFSVQAQTHAQKGAAKGAGSGAFLGAVAGAVFGDGDFLDDALKGAVVGGGVGALAGAMEGGAVDREQQQQLNELIRAFGEENLRGYIELIQCNHKKAIAFFKVGQVSDVEDHQLTGYWLEVIAEKDNRNTEKMKTMLVELVDMDPDIDDEMMARTAVDQYVLELRSDRRANQISCN
jgi:hypothetical protein